MVDYRVLIVDDEPHVVEAVSRMLESAPNISVEVYRANGAGEALRLLDEGRVDLVISDIEMPGMSGLELLERINMRWPMCRVAFLTAHSNFHYARRALMGRAVSYILKTQDDQAIQSEILKALDDLTQEMRSDALRVSRFDQQRDGNERVLLEQLLGANNPIQVMRLSGLPTSGCGYCLLLCVPSRGQKSVRDSAVNELVRFHVESSVQRILFATLPEHMLVWLVQLHGEMDRRTTARLFGLLETAQTACESAFGVALSMIMEPFQTPSCSPAQALSAARSQLYRITDPSQGLLYLHEGESNENAAQDSTEDIVGTTIDWVKQYIDNNVAKDVSLMRLSALTGYNGQYLSGIFHQRTGQTISRYVAKRRMQAVCELLKDPSVPIQTVSRKLGFCSRSYFNRFVKQETDMSPQQLRATLCVGTMDSSGDADSPPED